VVRLDRLAAERVQRHWDAGTGADGGFRRMLDLADGALAGTVEPGQAEREMDRFELVAEQLPADVDDEDLDSDAWETDLLASLAESSTPDQPDYDPEARRAFWRWYLSEAIPSIGQDRHH
jgi:immunity protein Imm5 of predicted polymorphic toxin system